MRQQVEFEIVGMKVLNKKTGERVFKQDVFVAVVGEKCGELKTEEVADIFYHRFDLEAGESDDETESIFGKLSNTGFTAFG